MTERLHFHLSLSCIEEGNGNQLRCSCLEHPRDGGAWQASVYGVAQSQTRLKRLSSSSSKGLVHKEIERKDRVEERRQERWREERKEGWTGGGRRGCIGRDLVCEALCKMNSPWRNGKMFWFWWSANQIIFFHFYELLPGLKKPFLKLDAVVFFFFS